MNKKCSKRDRWVAYILFEKLHFIFNRDGRVYTGDLSEEFNKNKEPQPKPILSRWEILDI